MRFMFQCTIMDLSLAMSMVMHTPGMDATSLKDKNFDI